MGQTIPLPKIYQDEDSSDSEGLELADGTTVGKKTTGGVGGSGGDDLGWGRKRGQDDSSDGDDPNKCRKTGYEGEPPRPIVAHKEPRQSGHSLPPDQPKAASPLHLSPEGENHTGPSRVRLDSGAEEEDT